MRHAYLIVLTLILIVGPAIQAATLSAPDFTLFDIHGREHRLSAHRGNVVLLNFWATWCPACREEIPSLQALAKKYRARGLDVLAISNETPIVIMAFAQAHGIADDFVFLVDPKNQVNLQYRVAYIPTTYLLTRDGKIASVYFGARNWQSPKIEREIENALKTK